MFIFYKCVHWNLYMELEKNYNYVRIDVNKITFVLINYEGRSSRN